LEAAQIKCSLPKAIICDADVLIDYLDSNKRIFPKISKQICVVYIPLPILSEVKQLVGVEAKKLGLIIFEPTLKQVTEASQRGGPLSFEDKICLIMARDERWACVTNDRNLRKKCREEGVDVMWGFDLMLLLNQKGELSKKEAQDTANKIRTNNPYIKVETLSEFTKKLK